MKEDKTVPQLRFPEFTDAWKQLKLSSYLDVSSEKNVDNFFSKDDVLSVSGDYGVVNQIEFQGRSFAGTSVSNYGVVHTGNVIYTKSPLKANPYGIIKTNKGESGIVSTLYAVYSVKENSFPNFIQDYFELNSRLNNYLRPLVNKGSKNDMKVSNENALKGLVIFPGLEEQRKISTFLAQLNNTITLQQRKLNSLQKLKKGLLQKMFPKKGENIPEIRFPEFSDAWKQRKFGDSFDFLQNNTLSRASLNDTSGCAKNVHYGDILVKFGESISAEKADLPFICDREILKKLSKSILKNGDVVIADTAEDMTTGKSCEIVDVDECMPVLAGLHTIPVRPKQKFGKYYLGYYLNSEAFHSQLIPLIQGIKVYSISKSSIKDTVVMFPDDVQEQEKIGSLFNRIDNTITLQQRKLESLQKLKKGLLQQMFI